jgi:diadenosine tetraphosphate (Ap4A) HIT family hydrolase
VSTAFEGNTTNAAYAAQLRDLASRDVCLFCPEHIHECRGEHIHEGTHWIARSSEHPYEGAETHIILIHRRHILHVREMELDARGEYWDMLDYLCNRFKIEGGGDAGRWGVPERSGVTINHLHRHLIVPKLDSPVYFGFGRLPPK